MNITKQIHEIVINITDNKLNQYRLEEELLVSLVQCKKQPLAVKSEAFNKIKEINEKQLEMLGHMNVG